MKTIPCTIRTTEEAQAYVDLCETRYTERIEEALASILTGEPAGIVALAGPTCSGKTTTAAKLTRRIEEAGRRAVVMSIDDFFTRNRYKGKIYKTTNMLGRTLAQYCPTDSAMAREQRRIEKELTDFEKNIFGDPAVKDSLDSVANAEPDVKEKKVRSSRRSTTSDSGTSARATRKRSTSGQPAARVTVRRQRH